nr:MAG: hypothetical protein [Bacteriophage sp.]
MTDITELAQRELYAKVEKQAHSLRGNPFEYMAITGMCPVNVVELHAKKIQALLTDKVGYKEEIAELRQRIAELESRTVTLPKPKDSDPGWKIDPEFISKVQNAIGYDDQCECWEGTPSMEVVEAVLLAAAGIKVEAE